MEALFFFAIPIGIILARSFLGSRVDCRRSLVFIAQPILRNINNLPMGKPHSWFVAYNFIEGALSNGELVAVGYPKASIFRRKRLLMKIRKWNCLTSSCKRLLSLFSSSPLWRLSVILCVRSSAFHSPAFYSRKSLTLKKLYVS